MSPITGVMFNIFYYLGQNSFRFFFHIKFGNPIEVQITKP